MKLTLPQIAEVASLANRIQLTTTMLVVEVKAQNPDTTIRDKIKAKIEGMCDKMLALLKEGT